MCPASFIYMYTGLHCVQVYVCLHFLLQFICTCTCRWKKILWRLLFAPTLIAILTVHEFKKKKKNLCSTGTFVIKIQSSSIHVHGFMMVILKKISQKISNKDTRFCDPSSFSKLRMRNYLHVHVNVKIIFIWLAENLGQSLCILQCMSIRISFIVATCQNKWIHGA